MGEKFAIAIIGAGPAGLSAAARAAELGVSHVLLEAGADVATTVRRYQKGKLVMAEPAQLPLRSSLAFIAAPREQVLATWQRELAGRGVHLRTHARVAAITGRRGRFLVRLDAGEEIEAEFVVVAIGIQGNIRRLDIPGDDLPGVRYQLDDPDEFRDETIVVVGGGDAGIENALALARQNRVILINRQDEFANCRPANGEAVLAAAQAGRIALRGGTTVERIDLQAHPAQPLLVTVRSADGADRIGCARVIARLGATPPRQLLEDFGVRFPNSDPLSIPQLDEQYTSNVPGLHVIGALAGYPLIKQALNQGYEVVEHILGKHVAPADEALLARKFQRVPGLPSVAAGIELVRRTQPLFAPLTTLQLREFLADSAILTPAAGEVMVRRNDYGDSLLSILRGTVRVLIEKPGGPATTFTLGCGEFFGEIGLLSGRRRSGTVVADEDCVLIETPRRSMLRLMDNVPAVQRRLDEVALKRVVQNCFGATMDDAQIGELVREAGVRRFGAGETVFREGDDPDALYLIRRGSVTVSREIGGREVVSAYISAGNYVGEMALVSKKPRTATIRTASPTEVVVLDAARFTALLGKNAEVLAKVAADYLDRMRAYESKSAERNGELVHFLVDQGIGEATDVLLIDYARCIRCDNCVAACADAHGGASRLDRTAGRTFEQVHIPASCRHCEHPRCMKDCPPDAIHRSLNGETFIGDNCIGCGNCQANCSYGVIQMAATPPRRGPGLLRRLFGCTPQTPGAIPGEHRQRAVKCDMCMDIAAGPACVGACPTGAAFRVSPEQFLETLHR